MRTTTAPLEKGLSMAFGLIHGKDFCCPQVVVILNGTAERPQFMMREMNPIIKVSRAA